MYSFQPYLFLRGWLIFSCICRLCRRDWELFFLLMWETKAGLLFFFFLYLIDSSFVSYRWYVWQLLLLWNRRWAFVEILSLLERSTVAGHRVRSGYGKSGKSMEFVFSISRPGKSMEICEKLWKLKKKVWNFLPFEKNFEDRKCAYRSSARKLLPCVWPKAARGLYRHFPFVLFHHTNCVRQAQSCLPAASNKKGTLGTVRLSRKDRSQVRPWILILDWLCSWTKSLRRSRSFESCFWLYRLHGVTSAKRDCFLPARIFAVSLRLPQRHEKLSFPLLCFLFFFFR